MWDLLTKYFQRYPAQSRVAQLLLRYGLSVRNGRVYCDSIAIPETSGTGGYDVYVRILGKPGGCLDADGYAEYDAENYGVIDSWYFSGHLDANRKTGVPGKVSVNDMFDVWVCVEVDTETGDCIDFDEISVFDDMFAGYFWQIQNQGLRNMQLIFYG